MDSDGRSILRRCRLCQAGRCTPYKESSIRTRSHLFRDLFGTPEVMVLLHESEPRFSSMTKQWSRGDLASSTIWVTETSAPLPSSFRTYARSLFLLLKH